MDDEGFPLLQSDARFIPLHEDQLDYYYNNSPNTTNNNLTSSNNTTSHIHTNRVDQESGEATGRKVVVLRSAPREYEYIGSELAFLHHSLGGPHGQFLKQSLYNRKTLYMHRDLLTTTDFTAYRSNDKVPPYTIPEFASTTGSPSGKVETKEPFKIPLPYTETRPTRNNNEVTISIWREFCRGPHVYQDTVLEWQALRKECLLWPHLQAMFGDFARFLPYGAMWLVRLVLVMLKICMPWLGFQLVYFHLLYIHIKIHVLGEKRGLKPVFVGGPSQGPIIYSIRNLCCPYCRHQKQRKASLRYFDKLYKERRDWAIG